LFGAEQACPLPGRQHQDRPVTAPPATVAPWTSGALAFPSASRPCSQCWTWRRWPPSSRGSPSIGHLHAASSRAARTSDVDPNAGPRECPGSHAAL